MQIHLRCQRQYAPQDFQINAVALRSYLGHRPGLEMFVPDPMPPEHVAGALQLLREFRRRGASGG